MNRDYSILIQFDMHLSRDSKYVFDEMDINAILDKITQTPFEKRFCLNFFLKHSILSVSSQTPTKTYYYNLEKIVRYKPYPNYKMMVELIKSEFEIELDFINLSIS